MIAKSGIGQTEKPVGDRDHDGRVRVIRAANKILRQNLMTWWSEENEVGWMDPQ